MTKVVHHNDMRMAESGQRTRLTGETLGKGFGLGHLGGEDFEGDQAVKLLLSGLVYCPHTALT